MQLAANFWTSHALQNVASTIAKQRVLPANIDEAIATTEQISDMLRDAQMSMISLEATIHCLHRFLHCVGHPPVLKCLNDFLKKEEQLDTDTILRIIAAVEQIEIR